MINPYLWNQLQQIKKHIESMDENSIQNMQTEVQSVIYSLGGTRDISQMSPGATALYLTILLELNR